MGNALSSWNCLHIGDFSHGMSRFIENKKTFSDFGCGKLLLFSSVQILKIIRGSSLTASFILLGL